MTSVPEDNRSRPVLLLLEDEAFLAAALCASLGAQFEIEVAANVDEARMLLGTRKYNIILSDHWMPGKSQGLDFLMEALERQPTAKRILMTGYLGPDLLARSTSLAQLSACLIKPIEIDRLRQELDQALGIR
jgi:DNA-binding NtrC family response regulator